MAEVGFLERTSDLATTADSGRQQRPALFFAQCSEEPEQVRVTAYGDHTRIRDMVHGCSDYSRPRRSFLNA